MTDERSATNSFEALALPLFGSLYNYAHWLTQNREEAEDLVQETYTKALKGFGAFQPSTNFRAWIYRILRNTFLTSRTGLSAKMTVPIEPEGEQAILPAASGTPETVLLARADQEALQSALEQLAPAFREVILLCDVEGMSYAEIAETLAVPTGTVMSRLSRARKMMRELLTAKIQARLPAKVEGGFQ